MKLVLPVTPFAKTWCALAWYYAKFLIVYKNLLADFNCQIFYETSEDIFLHW